jgi:hypothetical protein
MKQQLNEIKRMQRLAGLLKENMDMGGDSVSKEKVKEFIFYAAEEGTDTEYMSTLNKYLDDLLMGNNEVTREQFKDLINFGYNLPGYGPIGHGADPDPDELFDDMLSN